jgi:hypothetical protein
MSETQNPTAHRSKTLLVVGSLCTLLGLFMYGLRGGFAEFFLNAHFLFGLPLTGTDAFKVFCVAAGSVIMAAMGLVILGVGMALFLKSSMRGASQGNTAR